MEVKVTRWDVFRGKKHSRTRCPIARAVKRELNSELNRDVEVYGNHIRYDQYKLYRLSTVQQHWILDFDTGKITWRHFKPITLHIGGGE